MVSRALLLAFLALALALTASAQSPATTAFTAKDYAKYLTFVEQELPGTQFAAYQRVGISLAKTDGWDAETSKVAREKLKTSKDGLRQLEGAYLLARGELRGLKMLFLDGPAPGSPSEFTNVARLYREHGCEIAASACDVIYSTTASGNGMVLASDDKKAESGVRAWANIPAEQLAPLTQVVEGRFANNPVRLDDMWSKVDALARLATPGTEVDGLARVKGELCLLRHVRAIDKAREWNSEASVLSDGAISLAAASARRDSSNPWMITRAVFSLLETVKECDRTITFNLKNGTPPEHEFFISYNKRKALAYATALSLCQDAVKNMPEPGVRDARILYLTYLRTIAGKDVPRAVDAATLQENADLLLSADALLVGGKLPEAATKYTSVVNDAAQPLATRMDAWAGLLESDPATAFASGTALVTEISKLDADTRKPLVQWFAWHLWQIVGSDVALPKDEYNKPYAAPYRLPFPSTFTGVKVSTVKDGYTQMATLVDQCLAIDSLALLKQDPSREWMDLRLGLSMLYLLASQPEKSGKLALQRIDETLPAPPWGWRMSDNGMPETNSDKPKLFSYPDDRETLALIPDLIIAVNGSIIDARQGCDYYGYLAPGIYGRYMKTFDGGDRNYFDPIASVITAAITLLERDKPPVGPETTDLDVLFKSLGDFVNLPDISWHADRFAYLALVPIIRTAKTEAVQKKLFELIELSVGCYAKEEGSFKAGNAVDSMAKRMEAKRDNLKPYAQRLREKYPILPFPTQPVPPAQPAK